MHFGSPLAPFWFPFVSTLDVFSIHSARFGSTLSADGYMLVGFGPIFDKQLFREVPSSRITCRSPFASCSYLHCFFLIYWVSNFEYRMDLQNVNHGSSGCHPPLRNARVGTRHVSTTPFGLFRGCLLIFSIKT